MDYIKLDGTLLMEEDNLDDLEGEEDITPDVAEEEDEEEEDEV